MALQQALSWADAHEAEALARFEELLRIPSISVDPDHAADIEHCAVWLQAELVRIGLQQCCILPTGGPPIVYSEWLAAGVDRPTVLIYAHYDVMPVDPLAQWISPPFEPTIRQQRLYARGAIDDKCGVAISITALEAMLSSAGQLPLNVKVLFEGEEECGSPHLAAFVAAHSELLQADLLVVSDGGGQPGQPLIMAGVRGTVDAEVIVRGPRTDLHSGAYGGVVHNPIHWVGQMIAALHDADGRVRIPGFYADVRPLAPAERTLIASFEPLLLGRAHEETGLSAFWGDKLASYAERATALPTCDVNGIWGGYQGPGGKTVIPAQAGFKVSMRLVPGQDPPTIMHLFSTYVASFAVDTLRVEVIPGAANWPATLLYDGPVLAVLQQAYAATWGKPAQLYRAGGCVPLLGLIQQTLGTPLLDLGFGVGENSHAPNEYLVLDYFRRGVQTAIHFYHGLAGLPRADIYA
ncbi:dipeptidase [soil metagenome]